MSRAFTFLLLAFAFFAPPASAQWLTPPSAERAPASGWLGVTLDTSDAAIGVTIQRPLPGSPAMAAGLRPGDRVLSLNGVDTTSVDAFVQSVSARGAGEALTLHLLRRGEPLEVSVVLAERPADIGEISRVLEGQPMPLLTVRDARSGYATPLLDPSRTFHLVEFWATWCGPCAQVRPDVVALHERFAEAGLDVVAVSGEELEPVAAYLASHEMPYRVAVDLDDQLQTQLLAMVLPTWFLVDDEGTIVRVLSGSTAVAEIEAELASRLLP